MCSNAQVCPAKLSLQSWPPCRVSRSIFVCDVFAGLAAEEGRFDTFGGVFSECWSVIVEEVEVTRLEHRRYLFRFLTCADDPSRLLRLQRETKRSVKYAHEKCVALRTAPKHISTPSVGRMCGLKQASLGAFVIHTSLLWQWRERLPKRRSCAVIIQCPWRVSSCRDGCIAARKQCKSRSLADI